MQFRYFAFILSLGLDVFGSEKSEWTSKKHVTRDEPKTEGAKISSQLFNEEEVWTSWTPLTKDEPKTESSEIPSALPKEEELAYHLYRCMALLDGKIVPFNNIDKYKFKEILKVSGTSDIPDVLVRNVSNDHGVIAASQTARIAGLPVLEAVILHDAQESLSSGSDSFSALYQGLKRELSYATSYLDDVDGETTTDYSRQALLINTPCNQYRCNLEPSDGMITIKPVRITSDN